MAELMQACEADWQIFFRQNPPSHWSAIVLRGKHMILGMGGIVQGDDGRWWIFFCRAPGIAKHLKSAQKAARLTLAAAQECGLTVHAFADPEIKGSRKWLSRLGFEPTDEKIEGETVWRR